MTYPALVTRVSELSGYPSEVVRKILESFPDALIALPEGERVLTPMGRFEAIRRAARLIRPPNGGSPARVSEQVVIKLRPGLHLRRPPSR